METIYNLDGFGRNVATSTGRGYEYYIKDHLGSTMATYDPSTGQVKNRMEYLPYGKDAYGLQGDGLAVTPKFTTKEKDDEIGLNYFGARYYDPDLGVWISPDPAGQFASLYAYSPDPTNGVDKDGRLWGAIAGGVYTAYQVFDAYGMATGDWGVKNSTMTALGYFAGTITGIAAGSASSAVTAQGVMGVLAKYGIAGLAGAATGLGTKSIVLAGQGKIGELNAVKEAGLGALGGVAGQGIGELGGELIKGAFNAEFAGTIIPEVNKAVDEGAGVVGGAAADKFMEKISN